MRVTLCIGCNDYAHLAPLHGAEEDAIQMFDVLTDPNFGSYDGGISLLLLSPTLAQVRSALESTLYSGNEVTDFTLFFAGHGGVIHDTLYLCLYDTNISKVAISGLGFAELAKIVVSAKPSQANFILDACNSGGLGLDLYSILRQSLTGTAETTGVAALAAAAADEYAMEKMQGGVFTTALLRMLRGDPFVQRHKPYLDLPEIGAGLQFEVDNDQHQTVSTWVLNLQGPNRFSRNPHYDGELADHPDVILGALGRRLSLPRDKVAAIKRMTLDLRDNIDERDLAELLERLTAGLDALQTETLLSGLAEGMSEQARDSRDPFAEGRVLGVFLGQFLRVSSDDASALRLTSLLNRAVAAEIAALHSLDIELRQHRFGLIASETLTDLFFLPLRISDVFGRIGAVLLLSDLAADEVEFLRGLTSTLLETYGNSIVAVSDEQAAPLAVFIAAAIQRGWVGVAEEVIGRLYHDLIENAGRVARHFLDGRLALKVLERRYATLSEFDGELYQQPSDLVSITLVLAALAELDEGVDRALVLIDHVPLNIFIPDNIRDLGALGPINGKNFGLTVGHGVWRCIDIRREWRATVAPLLESASSASNATVRHAAVLAAIAMRDRVPWFLVAQAF